MSPSSVRASPAWRRRGCCTGVCVCVRCVFFLCVLLNRVAGAPHAQPPLGNALHTRIAQQNNHSSNENRNGAKVTLYESEATCGGHTLTDTSSPWPVDLGFQVCVRVWRAHFGQSSRLFLATPPPPLRCASLADRRRRAATAR